MNRKEKTQLKSIARALRHRNFRLFFLGQSVSLIGTWMQRIAVGWLVYRLTDSAFLLGVVGFAGQIPAFVLAPFAGVLADRWNRHRLLILTQALAMMQAFVLAYLVITETVVVWQIIVLSLVLGVVTAFDIPVRQSFMIEMIEEKTDLGNAIALNSSMVNGARLLGPSVAGLLIATVGEGMCFLFNGLSYLAVIASLLLMRIVQKDSSAHKSRAWYALKEGFKYVYDFEPIRAIILLLALMALMGMPYMVLMPIFARDILHGGPSSLGFLMGASGVGALAGALYLASRRGVLGLGKMIPIGVGIFGLGLIAFALSRNFFWSLTLLTAVGFGQMVQLATSNTLLQTMVDDDRRGRVMGFFTVAFVGMAPVGSLLAGALASVIGAPWTLFVGGVACLVGAGVFAKKLPQLREKVRPIYVEKGILPEIATGIECATDVSAPRK
ncbi:MAG: MFS transporter [Desulfomonilaceae bacterium]